MLLQRTSGALANLLVNGNFNTDVSGWTAFNGATLTWSAGKAQITNVTPGVNGGMWQSFATVAGRTYSVGIFITAGTDFGDIFIGTGIGSADLMGVQSGVGLIPGSFVGTGAPAFFNLMNGGTTAGQNNFYDNAFVR